MKCQKCEKPATIHITEIDSEEVMTLHLCAECAEVYLKPGKEGNPETWLQKHAKLDQTEEELAKLDKQSCPVCGITFLEFRQIGRLGCPHDYNCFEEELEPLIMNLHGATEHTGKRPKRPTLDPAKQTELIRLRREMKDAVDSEDYEKASKIRDDIRALEKESQS